MSVGRRGTREGSKGEVKKAGRRGGPRGFAGFYVRGTFDPSAEEAWEKQ